MKQKSRKLYQILKIGNLKTLFDPHQPSPRSTKYFSKESLITWIIKVIQLICWNVTKNANVYGIYVKTTTEIIMFIYQRLNRLLKNGPADHSRRTQNQKLKI